MTKPSSVTHNIELSTIKMLENHLLSSSIEDIIKPLSCYIKSLVVLQVGRG